MSPHFSKEPSCRLLRRETLKLWWKLCCFIQDFLLFFHALSGSAMSCQQRVHLNSKPAQYQQNSEYKYGCTIRSCWFRRRNGDDCANNKQQHSKYIPFHWRCSF